jgi:CDP-diacylglycerol--glycerol-3-phosphate 3-phosphatidyltransferase
MFVSLFSDGLDGYLARRLNQESRLGKFLDPLCDKIFLAAVLITLLYIKAVPLWAVLVIVLRDFLILLGSYILLKSKAVVEPSNTIGKITGFIFGSMILAFTIGWTLIGNILMYLSIPVMVMAFISYSVNYLRIMKGV